MNSASLSGSSSSTETEPLRPRIQKGRIYVMFLIPDEEDSISLAGSVVGRSIGLPITGRLRILSFGPADLLLEVAASGPGWVIQDVHLDGLSGVLEVLQSQHRSSPIG